MKELFLALGIAVGIVIIGIPLVIVICLIIPLTAQTLGY